MNFPSYLEVMFKYWEQSIHLYYVTNQQMHISKMCLSYINIHRHVPVASTTIIRVVYKKTNNIQTNVHKVQLKPPDVTFDTLSAPWGKKM